MEEYIIDVQSVSKQYRLGQIGSTTLRDSLQRLDARIKGKEDPTELIGTHIGKKGELFWALKDVSFQVKQGERVGIIGSNGAGKSTLLKLISQITSPTSGGIGLNGRVASMLEIGTGFHGELTGKENIFMNGAVLGMKKAEVQRKMDRIIEFSECGQFIDTPVKRYSSGMYVKLGFAVAAHLDSEILIMDEVLAVGDLRFQKKCIEKMNEVSREQSRTILYVSHNMKTIRELCTRCIVLDKGKLVYDGDVEKAIAIYSNSTASGETFFDLDKAARTVNGYGTAARLTELRFTDNRATFEKGEKLRFSIKLQAKEDLGGGKLYFILDHNGSGIGLAQTFEPFAELKAGLSGEYHFSFDLSPFSAGDYCFYLNLFCQSPTGAHISLDYPSCPVKFTVTENEEQKGIPWQPYFPAVSLPPIVKEQP